LPYIFFDVQTSHADGGADEIRTRITSVDNPSVLPIQTTAPLFPPAGELYKKSPLKRASFVSTDELPQR
jgi:hypothetical protein